MSSINIVLLQTVDRLGKEGEVVAVKAGFARNYLLPRELAIEATDKQIKIIEETKKQRAQKGERLNAQTQAQRRKLESQSLTLKLNLGEGDKPFGSITVNDIAESLKQEGFDIEKSAIKLEQPIKSLGIFEIPVVMHSGVSATIKLWVVKA